MNALSFNTGRYLIALLFLACVIGASSDTFAQREYDIEKPRQRSASERVIIRTKAVQPTKGVLAVLLNPIPVIKGQVVVKNAAGKIIASQDEVDDGQAEFQLQRGKVYQVEANFAGYLSATGKSKPLGPSGIVRLNAVAQFAALRLNGLPASAQILIDGNQRATVDKSGVVTINDLSPGTHTLLIRHPEHNDYTDQLTDLQAGAVSTYLRVPLERVAKLTIRCLPNATVLIDGELKGKVRDDGSVRIDYRLDQAAEHTIRVELLGYQTWLKKEMLAPGPRTIEVKLDPVITSAGFSDFFDNLSLWNAPSSWKIITDARNKKLEVRGESLGALSDKTYRDFGAIFKIWLSDGKGATWAVRADEEGRNYYLFHLAGPASTTHTPRKFYTYLVKDGGAPIEVSTPVPVLIDLNQKDSYTVRVLIEGHTIKQWIEVDQSGDRSDLGIWTDTTTTKDKFLYGSFGFRSLAGEVFTVDDLHLSLDLKPFKEQ